MHRLPTLAAWWLLGGLAWGLSACTSAPARGTAPRGQASAKAPALAASTSPAAAVASPKTPSPTPTAEGPASGPSLPLRLGLALPASLVGQAQGHLAGEDGKVAREGTRLVAGPGGLIVSNNSGSILSNNAGSIVGNHSGALIGDQGGNLVSDQGGAAVGRAWRGGLAQAGLAIFPDDVRFELWERLLIIDLADQLLQAYAQAGPRLDTWVPFALSPELLEPPSGAQTFRDFVAAQIDASAKMPYCGRLAREGEGLRLWVLRLPRAGAPPTEGVPAVDLQASGPQALVARLSSPPELRRVYAVQSGCMRLEHLEGGGLRFRSGDRFLPDEAWTAQNRALMGHDQPLARRREGEFRLVKAGQVSVLLREALTTVLDPEGRAGPWAERVLSGIGYAPPPQADLGLASWTRLGEGLLNTPFGMKWWVGGAFVEAPPTPVLPVFQDQSGALVSPAPAALQALLPPWDPALEAGLLAPPEVDEDPSKDPALAPGAPPAALLLAP